MFTEDFASLVVSGEKAWSEVSEYVEDVAPDLASRVTRWTSEDDVFASHRIDEQIAKAMDRKVWLPSGGSLVIDRTEAMTVVDVNTGKFVGSGGNLEETVTKNNLEAAEEIVRQLRLRDIGGIIVIDFIDMVLESNRDLVVRRLLECLGRDRTKHQVAEVTSLGLVQMTRKRVGSGLIEVFSEPCEHCGGRGHHRAVRPRRARQRRRRGRLVAALRGRRGRRARLVGRRRRGSSSASRRRPAGQRQRPERGPDRGGRPRRRAQARRPPGRRRGGGGRGRRRRGGLRGARRRPARRRGAARRRRPAGSRRSRPPPGRHRPPTDAPTEDAPAPARRSRRKRGRVVAPAGPPPGADAPVTTAAPAGAAGE